MGGNRGREGARGTTLPRLSPAQLDREPISQSFRFQRASHTNELSDSAVIRFEGGGSFIINGIFDSFRFFLDFQIFKTNFWKILSFPHFELNPNLAF